MHSCRASCLLFDVGNGTNTMAMSMTRWIMCLSCPLSSYDAWRGLEPVSTTEVQQEWNKGYNVDWLNGLAEDLDGLCAGLIG